MRSLKNRNAQVGETLTWIIATILIVVMVIFFLFGASLLGGTKSIERSYREKLSSSPSFEGTDPFLKKSLFTYVSLTGDLKKKSYEREFDRLAREGAFSIDFNETKKEITLRYNKR